LSITHADKPLPVAGLAGRWIALVPAEAFCAEPQAFDQSTLREGPLRVLGIDLSIVDDPKLDRVDAKLVASAPLHLPTPA
jgi:hypothetical protein